MTDRTLLILTAIAGVAIIAIIVGVAIARRRIAADTGGNPYIEGLQLLIAGRRNDAFARLQAAVKAGYAPTDAYIRLGELLRERGEAAKALQIHKSLTVKPELSNSERLALYTNLAEDYSALGRKDQAVDVLEGAVRRMNLRAPSVYRLLARDCHALGRTEAAYEYYRELRKLGVIGEREIALYLVSASQVNGADPKHQRKMLQRALKHDGQCAPAMLALGDVEAGEDHASAAIQHWKRAASISADVSREALARLEKSLYARGTFSEMERIYEAVIDADPSNEPATVSLARYYTKQGRADDAIALLDNFRAQYDTSARAFVVLMSLYAKHRDANTVGNLIDDVSDALVQQENFRCKVCGHAADTMQWHCPECGRFDSFVRE